MDTDFDRIAEALEKWIEEYTQSAFSSTVVEEASNPKNLRRLAEPDARGRVRGWCGDTMEIYLRLVGGQIEVATFMTDGCGPTLACGSMLTKMVADSSIEEALAITPAQLIDALGGLPSEHAHCAELAVRTLRQAMENLANPIDKASE